MSKKRTGKRKKARKARPVVVVNVAGREAGAAFYELAGRLAVAGIVGAGLAYAAGSRKQQSMARFVARHPAATMDLIRFKAGDVGNSLLAEGRQRWRRFTHRFRGDGHGEATSRPPTLPPPDGW